MTDEMPPDNGAVPTNGKKAELVNVAALCIGASVIAAIIGIDVVTFYAAKANDQEIVKAAVLVLKDVTLAGVSGLLGALRLRS